jgi:PAS domain S-box-containing protein
LDIIHFFEGLGASIGIAFSRKKAEQLLRESENKHRTLLENLPQKIFLKDTNSVYISCNENYARDLKITPEYIVGKTDYDFYPKELAEKYTADDKRIISSGQTTEIEEKYIRDGQEVTVQTVKTPARDDRGNMAGVLGIFWDITEHKKAQDALRESEEKYRDLFENARDAIVTTDVEAKITGVNKIVEEYGFKKEQLLGKSIFDFIVEQYKERGLKDFKAAISGNPVRGEMEVITPRGIFTAEYIDNPIKRAGEIIGIQAVLRDVTERRRAEQLLRKERDRAQKYLDVAGVMLVAIDSEQRVGLMNKKGCEILGYKEEEILGKNWFNNFLPERVQRQVQAVFQRLMCQQEQTVPERYENPILTKSGEERLMAWHNSVLRDDAGKVIAALGSGEDITEQRKAEQKSLQYQSQLRSVASQLTVAEERERYRIATELHDQIGQSLTISKIRVDTLHHSMKTGEHAKVLEEVCNCLSKAIGQVRSLTFDLSSPILHQLGFEAAVGSWLAEEIEAKHHISTIFEDDEQAKPLDDDVRTILFRNVRELLINVVKHAKAHQVRVSVRKIGSQIQVDVQDDGVGFDPTEALAEAARKDKFGLFSVKERLEQIGGRLQIESEPGHGCIVTMTAPLKKEEEINDGRI